MVCGTLMELTGLDAENIYQWSYVCRKKDISWISFYLSRHSSSFYGYVCPAVVWCGGRFIVQVTMS